MPKRVIFIFLVIFIAFSRVYAQAPNTQEKVIAMSFKILAKGFIAAADIDKIKLANARKIEKMSDEKFQKRYAKAYPVISGLPEAVKADYKVAPQMSRAQALRNIIRLDKEKLYALVDAIPDKLIAEQFNLYLEKKKTDLGKSNIAVEINKLWNKIAKKSGAK